MCANPTEIIPLDTGPPATGPLAALLNRPLAIGSITMASRLALAPMSQLGHAVLREVIDGFGGCGLLFSEMCSARRIPHENPRVSASFCWRPEEQSRLVVQILGAEPAVMAAAASRIQAEGLAGVDINCGCAAAMICKQGAGAALLREPQRAGAVVAAVRRAVSIPVLVKFRTGWRDDAGGAADLARRFADAGADALTFHPRVAPDRRCRPAKWEQIAAVKQAVAIPVLGNGDVADAADCLKMLETTGCDAVALGRLAVARPWIFAAWTAGFVPGEAIFPQIALALADGLAKRFEPATALKRLKRFVQYFAVNFHFGHHLFSAVRCARSFMDARTAIEGFFALNPQTVARPNLNLHA